MTIPVIEFKNVHKSFGDHDVLKGVSISVFAGETLTILGGSGTGKSVFLKLLLGIIRPDEGEVLYKGKVVDEMLEDDVIAMRSKIGMLFQGSALFDSLTVGENIAYPLREHFDFQEDKIENRILSTLDMVGLAGIEDLMPSELSGGMKKRVGLARAISTEPDIILYDEPTTGLDPANTKRINNLIRELQKKLGVTSLVVTHDLESAFFVSDRLALIDKGKFGFVGTKEEAKNSDNEVVKKFLSGKMETGDSYSPNEKVKGEL